MPVTFGSVGDIISVCLLVKDLVDTLDKARGSQAEYQSLIRELWILDRSLLEVDLLTRIHGGGATPELEALCETARRAVDRCRELLSEFSTRVQKYQKSLGENQMPGFVKATAMKVRWRIGEKDTVNKFRVEIAGTSASLQMLLATASVKLMGINGKEMKDHMATIKQQNESTLDKQDTTLITINDRLEETNRLITSGNSVTAKIADALRFDWLQKLGIELKQYMRRIIAMNIATYHAVISIQSALPNHLERGLIEEPFVLEDAIGRIAPVHLQFVTSWDAFNAVLQIRFRNMQGFKRVMEKQYSLQEKVTKRDIDQNRPWQRAFLPGQRIEMSFLFDIPDDNRDSSESNATCPGCQTPSKSLPDVEIQCDICKIWFQRIIVVHDEEPLVPIPVPSPWRSKSEFGKPGFTGMVSGPVRPGKKRVAPTDLDGEDELREFKRVRLIEKKMKRKKLYAFEQNQPYKSFSDISKSSTQKSSTKPQQHEQDLLPAVRSKDFYKNANSSSLLTLDRPSSAEEIVEEQLARARKSGLLSKAVPDTNLAQKYDQNNVDTNDLRRPSDMFWDPRWFPELSRKREAFDGEYWLKQALTWKSNWRKLHLLEFYRDILPKEVVAIGNDEDDGATRPPPQPQLQSNGPAPNSLRQANRKRKTTHYDSLQVSPTATETEIKKAYRKLAMKLHPDKYPGDESAHEEFRTIGEAYRVLSDETLRKQYDQHNKDYIALRDKFPRM